MHADPDIVLPVPSICLPNVGMWPTEMDNRQTFLTFSFISFCVNINRKSWVADRSVPVPTTLNDLEGRNARGQILKADLRNYALTARPKTNKFGMVNMLESGIF